MSKKVFDSLAVRSHEREMVGIPKRFTQKSHCLLSDTRFLTFSRTINRTLEMLDLSPI